jgi:hypothetical protein
MTGFRILFILIIYLFLPLHIMSICISITLILHLPLLTVNVTIFSVTQNCVTQWHGVQLHDQAHEYYTLSSTRTHIFLFFLSTRLARPPYNISPGHNISFPLPTLCSSFFLYSTYYFFSTYIPHPTIQSIISTFLYLLYYTFFTYLPYSIPSKQ